MSDKADKAIPALLHNEDEKKPHQNCRICNKDLMNGEMYAIQKVFKNYPEQEEAQVLFDFAMCQQCMTEARAELSLESRMRIDQFMMDGMHSLESSGEDPESRFANKQCTISGKNLSESQEYQVMAVCEGNQLIESPICLSDEVLEHIQELLSEKSRDELNRFTENNFGWPPELKKALQDGDLVLL